MWGDVGKEMRDKAETETGCYYFRDNVPNELGEMLMRDATEW